MRGSIMPVREERLCVFVKCAHVPEGKAEKHALRMSWAIVCLAGGRGTLLSSVSLDAQMA